MKQIYIETTIISYLTAKPSRDIIRVAHQQITLEWWEQHRQEFALYVSQLVLDEVAKGDADAALRRQQALQSIPLLPLTETTITLAEKLISSGLLTPKASADALHLAVATAHRMDFLLTWNCRHLANARILTEIERFFRTIGYEMPFVCTPEELMGGES